MKLLKYIIPLILLCGISHAEVTVDSAYVFLPVHSYEILSCIQLNDTTLRISRDCELKLMDGDFNGKMFHWEEFDTTYFVHCDYDKVSSYYTCRFMFPFPFHYSKLYDTQFCNQQFNSEKEAWIKFRELRDRYLK